MVMCSTNAYVRNAYEAAGVAASAALAPRQFGGISVSSMNSVYTRTCRFALGGRAWGRGSSDAANGDVGEMPKKVMIVEDNELNMKLFRDLIEATGYETVRTRNGLEALDLARTHKPDLILMDIQLPEVSGLEVTKWLKEDDELHSIPVIAVTAFAMKGDEERIRQGGCEAYISKPISVPKFIETIKSYLGDA
jgi:two-component system cell cycle response regulator DivK